jgi:hypothetical protein
MSEHVNLRNTRQLMFNVYFGLLLQERIKIKTPAYVNGELSGN